MIDTQPREEERESRACVMAVGEANVRAHPHVACIERPLAPFRLYDASDVSFFHVGAVGDEVRRRYNSVWVEIVSWSRVFGRVEVEVFVKI